MAYVRPPTGFFTSLNTSGVVNTDITHTLLAAPGAQNAYRVSLICMSYAPANTGVVELRSGLAGNLAVAMAAGPTGPGNQMEIPEPGYLLAVNQALTIISRSNVVTQAFRVVVWYYIDNIA